MTSLRRTFKCTRAQTSKDPRNCPTLETGVLTGFLSFFHGWQRPNKITGLRPNVNTLTLLVRTSIDKFIFHTLRGATPLTTRRTAAQSFGNPQLLSEQSQDFEVRGPEFFDARL